VLPVVLLNLQDQAKIYVWSLARSYLKASSITEAAAFPNSQGAAVVQSTVWCV